MVLLDILSKFIYQKFIYMKLINDLRPISVNYNFNNISEKERIIIKMICEGKSDQIIAEELNISKSTVRAHINNIFIKLHINNRAKLIMHFINYTIYEILNKSQ